MGSGLQLFLRSPRLAIGDVDGDGRVDIVALGRHDIRVFLRREDGQFPGAPDRLIFPRRVSARDHVRGAGEVRGDARDLDADGRLDLMISHASGNLSDARTRIDFYLNRGGVWRLDEPDVTFSSESRWSMEQLLDVDGDARPELVRVGIPVSILELAEMLLTRAVDAYVSVHRAGADGRFASEPWIERKLGVPVAFERGQTRGFMPTLSLDLDGDGRRDLLTSGGGDALEVHRLREDGRFARALRSPMSTAGRLRAGDIDADGRVDLLLFDPRDPDAPVRVVRNRGLQAEDRAQ
jgi:hypothetical protein